METSVAPGQSRTGAITGSDLANEKPGNVKPWVRTPSSISEDSPAPGYPGLDPGRAGVCKRARTTRNILARIAFCTLQQKETDQPTAVGVYTTGG